MNPVQLLQRLSKAVFAIAAMVVLLGATQVRAATYYVALDGNDGYSGTFQEWQGGTTGPWRTLAFAMTQVVDGDILYIEAGNYAEALNVTKAVTIRIIQEAPATIAYIDAFTINPGAGKTVTLVANGGVETLAVNAGFNITYTSGTLSSNSNGVLVLPSGVTINLNGGNASGGTITYGANNTVLITATGTYDQAVPSALGTGTFTSNFAAGTATVSHGFSVTYSANAVQSIGAGTTTISGVVTYNGDSGGVTALNVAAGRINVSGLTFNDDTNVAPIDALLVNVAAGSRLDVNGDVVRPDAANANAEPYVNVTNAGTANFNGATTVYTVMNSGTLAFAGTPTVLGDNTTLFTNALGATTTFGASASTVNGDVSNAGTIVNNTGQTSLTFTYTGAAFTQLGTINGSGRSVFSGVAATVNDPVQIAGTATISSTLFTWGALSNGAYIAGATTVSGTVDQATFTPTITLGSLVVTSAGLYNLGGGTLNIEGDFTLQQPTPPALTNFTTVGATLNFVNGATPANGTFLPFPGFVFNGGTFSSNKPGRTLSFGESVTLTGGAFTVPAGTVNFVDEQAILTGAVAVTINGITQATTGGIDVQNPGVTLGGSGQFTNLAINSASNLGPTTTSSIIFNGTISLLTGTLNIGPGFDLSAVANTTPKIIRNTANANAAIALAGGSTVGLQPIPYDVEYINAPVANPYLTGPELGTVYNPSPLRHLTFSTTAAGRVDVGTTVSLSGTLTVAATAIVSGTAGTEQVQLATAGTTHTVAGLITNADATLTLVIVGDNTVIQGGGVAGANVSEIDALTVSANGASVSGIHAINGALVTSAGSSFTLTLAQDIDLDGDGVLDAGDDFDNGEVNGTTTLGGTSFTLGANAIGQGTVNVNAGSFAFGANTWTQNANNFNGVAGITYTGGTLVLGLNPAGTNQGAESAGAFGTFSINGGSLNNLTVVDAVAQATDATVTGALVMGNVITSGANTVELYLAGNGTFNAGSGWAGAGTFVTTGTNLTGNVNGIIPFTNFTVSTTSNAMFIDGVAGAGFPTFEISGAFTQQGNVDLGASVVLDINEPAGASAASFTRSGGTLTGTGTLRFSDDAAGALGPPVVDNHIPVMNTAGSVFNIPNLTVTSTSAGNPWGQDGIKLTGDFTVSSTLVLTAGELDHTSNAATSLGIGSGVGITRNIGTLSGTPNFTDGTTTVTYVNAVGITTGGELHTTVASVTTGANVGAVTLAANTGTTVTGTFAAAAGIVFGQNASVSAATYTQTGGTTTFVIVAPATSTTSTLTANILNNQGGGIFMANGVGITVNTLANLDAQVTHPASPSVATFTLGSGGTIAMSVNPAFVDPSVPVRNNSYVLANAASWTLQFDGFYGPGVIAGIDWPAAYVPTLFNVYSGGNYNAGSLALPGNRSVVNLAFGNTSAAQGLGSLDLGTFNLTVTGNVTQGQPAAGGVNGAAVPVVDMSGLGAFILAGSGNSTITVNPLGWESPMPLNGMGLTNWDGTVAPAAGKAPALAGAWPFAGNGYSPNFRFVVNKTAATDQVIIAGGDLDLSLGAGTNPFGTGLAPLSQPASWVTNAVFVNGVVNAGSNDVVLYHGVTGAIPNQPVQGFAHCPTNPSNVLCTGFTPAAGSESHVATMVTKLSLSRTGAEVLVGAGFFAGGDATAFAGVHNSNITFPTGTLNPKYRPATLFFPAPPPADVMVTMSHGEGNPGGQNGFRDTNGNFVGIEAGAAGPITNYMPFYWSLMTDQSIAPSFQFEASFTANGFFLDGNCDQYPADIRAICREMDIDDVRLIRRHDLDEENEWILQAGTYDNSLNATAAPTVTVRNAAIGGFVNSGIRFAFGERNQRPVATQVAAAADTPQNTVMLDINGDPVTVNVTDADLAQTLNASVSIAPALAAGADTPTVAPASGASPQAFVVSWTPGFDVAPGNYVITLSITDGTVTTTHDINVTVLKTNRAPVFTDELADGEATEGTALAFAYAATDADGDAITYAVDPAVDGAVINANTGAFTFTPTFAQAGTVVTIIVTATDADGAASATQADITVRHRFGLCDVTEDGSCSPLDADYVLQNSASNRVFTAQQNWAGDVSGLSGVTSFDASLILQYDLGSITTFPAGNALATKGGEFGEGDLAFGQIDWSEGVAARVPLAFMGKVDQVYSVTFRTVIDPAIARVNGVQISVPEDWRQLSSYDEETGSLVIVAAGASALAATDEFASIQLTMADESARLSMSASAFVNERAASELAGVEVHQVPTEFALAQNFPNPFNPTTVISYSLPENQQVALEIYDVTGRLVTTLVNREQEAGRYRIQWDGRTAAGTGVASGLYIYRLRAGSFVQTKTMMLVK